jgi:hypothetical protein
MQFKHIASVSYPCFRSYANILHLRQRAGDTKEDRARSRYEDLEAAAVLSEQRCSGSENRADTRSAGQEGCGRDELCSGNWTFFGSDHGGETAAVLLSFVAMCKRSRVEPFAWFRDVLSRIATHPVNGLAELFPQHWTPLALAQA